MAAKSTAPRSNASLNVIAPLPGLPFPAHANLTAAELLAFLPNCLKCADVVYRFVSNSGTRKAIYNMINTFRDSEVPWTANCCGSMMYKTMKVAGFQGWNLKKHNDWHADNMASWDGDKLDVGSFQTPNKPAQSVSFKSLGAGIRKFPDGDDALDLTRMVQYCLEHPAEVWVYPDDYAKLLTVLGGAQEPTKENTDAAVFVRWENRSPPLPAVRSVPPEVKRDEPETDVDKTANAKRKETSTTPPRLEIGSRPGTPASAGPPEQPKPKRPKKQAKTEPLATLEDFDLDTEHRGCIQPYIRQLAEYVMPPGKTPVPSAQSILLAFEHDGAAGETDPYSAYAFGGPRATPPYRLLHEINQPRPYDLSSWAENLRWEFEQRALFAHPETKRWNEGPEHMARIEHERVERVWASDELQDSLLD